MNPGRSITFVECAGWGLAATALVALGMVWHHDRTRAWESPRWDDALLVPLRGPQAARGGSEGTVETWAVAVNPGCPLCRGSLERGHALRRLARAPVRLAVLIVDARRRPPSATLALLPADEVRWDSAGVWRRRWGHRVYGELLCFDRDGRHVRTLAPLSDSLAARRAFDIGGALARGGGS